jgi:hypothetical protein
MDIEEVRDMRKGILSLGLPGMRRAGNRKTAGAEQGAEKKAAAYEEPEVDAKSEKPFIQTIMLPKKHTSGKRKNLMGKRTARKPEAKK